MNIKSSKFLNVVLAVLIGIAGLLTVIFSILALANVKGVQPSAALRYLLATSLCIVSIAIIVLALAKEKEKKNAFELVIGGALLGLGIFFFIKGTDDLLNVVVCFLMPLMVACIGAAFLFKGIIGLSKGGEGKDKYVMVIIASILLIVAGVLFAVFADKTGKIMWLIVGLVILAYSVYEVIVIAKNEQKK